jgi:hypothetical protein
MNSPPAARPETSRTGGRGIEVCNSHGDFLRRVEVEAMNRLITEGLAIADGDRVRLRPGIRWVSPRNEKPTQRLNPNLDELKAREPDRYGANWRGSHDPHIGRGALGRRTTDRVIVFAPEARP